MFWWKRKGFSALLAIGFCEGLHGWQFRGKWSEVRETKSRTPIVSLCCCIHVSWKCRCGLLAKNSCVWKHTGINNVTFLKAGDSCRSYLILACVKCQLWWIVTTVVHRQALSERNVISWIYVQTGWQIPVLPIAQKAEATAELCLQILQCFLTSSSGAEVTTEAQWELAQGQADISLTGHKKNNSDALKSAKHQGLMFFLFYLFTVIIKLLRQECSQSLFMVVN